MTISLTSFIYSFIKRQFWSFLIVAIVSFVWALDHVLWPYLLQKVTNIFIDYENARAASWDALKPLVLFGVLLWLGVEGGFRTQGFLLARSIPKLEADIRLEMFDHVQHHSPKYFNEHFAGSLSNKISDMTTHVSQILQKILTLFLPAIAAVLLGIFFFSQISPLFAWILFVWVVVHSIVCVLFTKKCAEYEDAHGESRSELMGSVVDSFTNNFAVNLYYRFVYEKNRIFMKQEEEKIKNTRAKFYVEYMRVVLGFGFITGGFLLYGFMIAYWMQGKISTGEAIQIFNTVWNLSMIIWLAGSEIPLVFQSLGIAKQAFSVMQDPRDVADVPNAIPLKVGRGEIVFDNVSFQYGKRKLFQNKDVIIHGGEKVGLVGYSGAGKSTFVNLILRLFPVKMGKILIDGQDISNVTLASLREQIALIPQDPLLFHRSLKENIAFGNLNASNQDIIEAAELAHCDLFIQKLSLGYETEVGERGTKLSGGERQRIAIARAFLSKAPVLILDEATSALDSVTEKLIQDSLEVLMRGKTALVIAHRLSTLSQMDRILVFDQGKIVEEGSHDSLLDLGGHYTKMWQMQTGGFLPEEAV